METFGPMHLVQNASLLQQQQSPLQGKSRLHELVHENTNDLSYLQQMTLISGVGDFCQVYVTYKTESHSSLIIFTFKVVNMTNFQIQNLALSFQSSQNLQVRPN